MISMLCALLLADYRDQFTGSGTDCSIRVTGISVFWVFGNRCVLNAECENGREEHGELTLLAGMFLSMHMEKYSVINGFLDKSATKVFPYNSKMVLDVNQVFFTLKHIQRYYL